MSDPDDQADDDRGPFLAVLLAVATCAFVITMLLFSEPLVVSVEPLVLPPPVPALRPVPRADREPEPAKSSTPLPELDRGFVPGWVRDDPRLHSLASRLVWVDAPPFRVAQAYPVEPGPAGSPESPRQRRNAARRAKAELLARRQAYVLQETHRRFHELFADPLGLDARSALDPPLQTLSLWDRREHRDWVAEFGRGETPAASRHYDRASRWIVSYVGEETLRLQDVSRCANERLQRRFDQHTAALCVEQLLHGHAARARDAGTVSRWLVEGLGAFLSGFEHAESADPELRGARWHHGRLVLELVATARAQRAAGGPWWSVRALVGPRDLDELVRRANARFPAADTGWMCSVFRAQAWGFVHFCWFYDGGRYRGALREALRRELGGERGPDGELLAAALGLDGPADWAALQREFDGYWRQCLDRRVGRRIDPRTGVQIGWHRTDTAPPTGRCPPIADDALYDD